MNQQAKALRQRVLEREARRGPLRTRAIAVTSGKGGVGKTTLAANLAIALQRTRQRVALIDVDLGLANVDILLGLLPTHTLQHVLEGTCSVAEIAVRGPEGVRIVPAGSGIEGLANLTPWQQERLWGGFAELDEQTDLVLIDTAAGIAPNVLNVLAATPEVVVVTVPEPAAVTDAYALIKVLARHNPEAVVHLVVNRAAARREAAAAAARIARVAQRFLGIRVRDLGFVLDDPAVRQSAREQRPFVSAYPGCAATRGVRAIASRLRHPARVAARRSLAECMQELSRRQADSLVTAAE